LGHDLNRPSVAARFLGHRNATRKGDKGAADSLRHTIDT
jgi:hypothetical protein